MKRFLGVCLLLLFCLAFYSSAFADKTLKARIHFKDKSEMKKVLNLDLDRAYLKYGEYLDIISDSSEVEKLRASGYQVEVIIADLSSFYQKRMQKALDMGGFHTYSETGAALDSIHSLYPGITTAKINIGNSLEGRPIWALKISDNPSVKENEPQVLYTALIHAREPIGIEILLYFMHYLCQNYNSDSTVTYLVNNRELWFIPIINPDGYEWNRQTAPYGYGMWRKNRRPNAGGSYGVDLNRNFGYQWGYDNVGSSPSPSSETFRGTAGFSEPETQVIRAFVDSSNFVLAMNYHAFGNDFLYPWGYDVIYTPDQPVFKAIADSVHALNGCLTGTSWEVLYLTNGDSDDWMYGEQTEKKKILAFTPEVGDQDDDFWPDPSRIIPLCELQLQPNLFIASLAGNPYALLPPLAPILVQLDSVITDNFTLTWTHPDTFNPAVSYSLVEMENLVITKSDAESGLSGWDTTGFSLSTSKSYSPTHSFFSGSGNNLDNYLTSSDFISVRPNDTLTFWCYYSIESGYDYLYLEASEDGTNFHSIPGNITTNDNPNGLNFGNGITGSSEGWVKGIFDLSQFWGKDILLRFHYKTDESVADSGFWVDDIYPVARFQKSTLLADTVSQKSYPVKKRCSGVYYYKAKAKDAQGQESPWSERIRVAVGLNFIRGDANADGKVTVADIVYLVSYLFKHGPAPSVLNSGDANFDGKVNTVDIVYLVNYLFKHGPVPCAN
ncbi:MAG TPA: M14 family zinc carboxypeptidase [Terriglobales bacterium]|nr:M14 family zinc carboxypeptidase [Terriglobales bacterium]